MAPERFPHSGPFLLEGEPFSAAEILHTLGPLLHDQRKQRIAEVVAARTYSVVPVLEGLYDRGNVSAVLRSAEALGYQRVHVIDSSENFKEANRVTQGADKWIDIDVTTATAEGLAQLRAQGYRILATCFEEAQPIDTFAFDTPTALVFGNEHEGVSETLLAEADARVVIPISGCTRSFNISVAAALALYHVQRDRMQRRGHHGDLTPEQQTQLTASYYLRSVAQAERILLEHRTQKNAPPPERTRHSITDS